MPTHEIEEIKQSFIKQILPIKIYLFGSYANETFTNESDLDFYIVVPDEISDLAAETSKAYRAIRQVKKHSVDIVLNTNSRFEARKHLPSIENEVYQKGVLLYDAGNQEVV